MGVIWSKVGYDLWNNKVRTVLVVISIAVGVFAVGAIFGMSDQMITLMDRTHQADMPQHITLALSTPIDRDTALALRRTPGVEDIEPTNSVNVRYRFVNETTWHQGVMQMRDDYLKQKYQLLRLKEGEWPKGNGISMEHMQAVYYNIKIGDSVIFEIDKKEHALPVTGQLRHPFTPPPSLGYDLAFFFADATTMERFGMAQGRFSTLLVRVTPYSAQHAREVASEIKDRLGQQGVGVAATMYQDPAKHWGRMFMDPMMLVMQVMAVISLLLSTVLVLNTFTALITQQTNQIGVMKAVGGTSGTIIRIYLVSVLIYGVLALVVSFPLGALSAFGVSQSFLALFNIPYDTFQVSPQALVLQLFAALIVPLIAALWPVLHGAGITVREAIASYGLGGDYRRGRVDQAIERFGGRFLPSHLAVSLANTFRRKGRLILTESVLIVAGTMFLMLMGLNSSIASTLDTEFARRDYDLTIVFQQPQRIDRAVAIANNVDGVEKAEMLFAHSVTLLRQGQKTREAGLGSQLLGVPAESPMYTPMIVAGRWLQPGDEHAAVILKDIADENGLNVGDTITLDLAELGKSEWQIVGLHKALSSSDMDVNNIYVPRDAILQATRTTGRGIGVLVRTRQRDAAGIKAVADQLQEIYRLRNMKVASLLTGPGERINLNSRFSIVIYMFLFMAFMAALVGGIGQMGALSISVIERTKEVGILRAIGARSGTITGMFLLEGTLQGLLSWLIAFPLSLALAPLFSVVIGRAMFGANLDYRYDLQAAGLWLVIVLIIGAVASLGPARSATRISVRSSLAYE